MNATMAHTEICRGSKYDEFGNIPLATSAGRSWRGARAELRSHLKLNIGAFIQPATEVAIMLDGHAQIDRRGDSRQQRFMARPGTFCICPADVSVDYLQATGSGVKALHLYIDASNDVRDLISGWPYAGGLMDPLIAQVGTAIAEEIHEETAGSELLLDALKDVLIARINRHIRRTTFHEDTTARGSRGIDSHRLARVLAFLEHNLEAPLSLADIAAEACLSRYHFLRAFKVTTGKTPHQYLSELRLQRARELLTHEDASIDAIAHRLRFSNAANFSRAFKRDAGITPGAYRSRAHR